MPLPFRLSPPVRGWRRATALLMLATLLVGLSPGVARAAPAVVVSIKPLHALAAGLMRGVGRPALLVRGSDNPHTFTLRPSDAASLARADLVFWMGGTVEPALARPLDTLAGHGRVVSMMTVPGVTVLPARLAGLWPATGHDPDPAASGQVPDGHLWLDPDNARAMVRAMATALETADPADAAAYRANLVTVLADIDTVDRQVAALLAPVHDRPFIVYHDAFQYFEAHYHLAGIGALTVSPDVRPGAGSLARLHDRVKALGPICVFGEPPFEPRQVAALTDGTQARQGVLDPEGVALSPGPDLYAQLMLGNARALAACLER